jgi:hypothetical protein
MSHPRPAQQDETGHESHHGSHEVHPRGETHSGAAHWEHLAHYAHEAHLAAEAIESTTHGLHHLQEYLKHAQAGAKLIKAHAQMAYDLRRMRAAIAKLEQVVARGGKPAVEAGNKLKKAKEALASAEEAFAAERSAVRAAYEFASDYKAFKSTATGAAKLRLGQAVTKFEVALRASRVGRDLLRVGRITASKPFVRGLVVVGSAFEGIASYSDSTAKTTIGKSVNAALGAGSGALTMANPYVAGGDVLLPKGYKLSELYHGGATAVTAIGEGLLRGDCEAMDEFHRRSMQGHYGKVMQAASEAGEFWAAKGIVGGLKEFAEGVRWWVSH